MSALGYGHADDIARQLQNADNSAAPPWYMHPDARKALAERDIGAVYRLLYRDGVNQQEIARLTGQRQSEVWEIMHSGRQGRDITVLERIADGRYQGAGPDGPAGGRHPGLTWALLRPGWRLYSLDPTNCHPGNAHVWRGAVPSSVAPPVRVGRRLT